MSNHNTKRLPVRNLRNRTLMGVAIAVSACLNISHAQTVSTSFENIISDNFVIGESPESAQFIGGRSQTIGNRSFYRTGRFSWHVPPVSTAMAQFETPLDSVSFWFRRGNIGSSIVARIIDTNGDVIREDTGTATFTNIQVTRAAEETAIARVEFTNDGDRDSLVDDFEFTGRTINTSTADPVDEPTGPEPGLADPIPAPIASGSTQIELTPVLTGLTAPLHATHAPNHPDQLYVVDQIGLIQTLDLPTGRNTLFLDVRSLLVPLGVFGAGTFDERGLLGLAFHPDYAINGLVYTYTSEPVGAAADFSTMPPGQQANHQSVITEWRVTNATDPFTQVDLTTRRELMRLDQPQFNHNAGSLVFDADNLLYISLGDGGGADDVDGQDFLGEIIIGHGQGNAQNLSNPLGSILRIDPTGTNSANGNYGIPSANPFIGVVDVVNEIFAYGFRNPYRMSFDATTGQLWVSDAGQNDIEEINQVTAGGNYGWNIQEGSFLFNVNGDEEGFVTEQTTPSATLTNPVAEYDHDEGLAVIGGFVYRGSDIPALSGRYIFGDFGQFDGSGGRLFYLDPQNTIVELLTRDGERLDQSLSGFGQDTNGELYVLANELAATSGSTGVVYRLSAVSATNGSGDGSAENQIGNDTVDNSSGTSSSSGGGVSGITGLLALYSCFALFRRRKLPVKC